MVKQCDEGYHDGKMMWTEILRLKDSVERDITIEREREEECYDGKTVKRDITIERSTM